MLHLQVLSPSFWVVAVDHRLAQSVSLASGYPWNRSYVTRSNAPDQRPGA